MNREGAMLFRVLLALVYEGIVFRGILAIMCVGAAIYLLIQTRDIPEWFQVTIGVVMGYFFGSKTIETTQATINRIMETPVP